MPRQEVRTYDPDRVIVTVNGQRVTGFASGDSIKVTRDAEYWTKQVGLAGAVSRSRKHSIGGQFVFTLQQTSPFNQVLTDLLAQDNETGTGLLNVQVRDTGGFDLAFSEDGWIMQDPEMTFGEESSNREWTIDCGHLTMVHGGNE
jgi:hypothetical protein